MLQEIMNNIYDKINQSLKITNVNAIFSKLDTLEGNTIVYGVGGSQVVSVFFEKVLHQSNKVCIQNMTIEEILQTCFDYNNLVVISHSGKNHAVKYLMNLDKNKYLLTTRKSKIKNEILLTYSMYNRTKSFISLDDTLTPLSILLCYYLGINEITEKLIPKKRDYHIQDFNHVNIIYDYNTKTCATFLETSLVEAGICSVTMHTKYSFCHGRSNLVSNHESLVIYLTGEENELDLLLLEQIPRIESNFLSLKSDLKDPILLDYVLTIQAFYFLDYLNQQYGKEFVDVKYNKIIPTLYHFKGEWK